MQTGQDPLSISPAHDHLFPLALVWTASLPTWILDLGPLFKRSNQELSSKDWLGDLTYYLLTLGFQEKKEHLGGVFQYGLL